MTAAVQLTIDGVDHTPASITTGLVELVAYAPAVEVRVLDTRHLDTGGRRGTARDAQGRPLRTTHAATWHSVTVPAWTPLELLTGIVDRMRAELAARTPAPATTWSWRALPLEAGS